MFGTKLIKSKNSNIPESNGHCKTRLEIEKLGLGFGFVVFVFWFIVVLRVPRIMAISIIRCMLMGIELFSGSSFNCS